MENKLLTMIWTLIVALSLLSGSTQALSFSENGYELTIAISEDAHRIADGDRRLFLQSLREIMTATSQSLFVATDNYYYFSKVNILIPPNWESTVAPSPVSVTNLHNYLNADMRVETTIEPVEEETSIPVKEVRTSNSKLCGHPGEYIIVPPCFFNSSCPDVKDYGDRAKALVREFAHYRYGVHDEHGFTDVEETKFTYTFVNTQGHTQITGCNNTEIVGSYRTNENIPCDYQTEPEACRFRPNMTQPNGPISSLLFMQFLPTVSKFCDSTTHDRSVPNKQNYWCRNRSVKTVMMQSPEFKNNKPNPLPPNANTAPLFNYFVRASQTVYIVMDTSSHTPINEAVFNYTKTQITQNLIPNLVTGSKRSFVGLATMGGTNVNLTNGQLTGYLTEIQSPIDISSSGNDQILKNKVNTLTRSSGSGLLLEKAVLDVGDILTSYTYLSGSIVILVKLSDITDTATMSTEAEAVHLLNSRNIRLVSYEYNIDSNKNKILERTTSLTGGTHFPASSSNYQAVFTSAINKTLELLQVSAPFRNRRIQLTRDPFTSTNTKSYSGFFTIDFATGSVTNAEINFFIPAGRPSDYAITVTKGGTTYNINSEVHSQRYLSWDNKYKVHTFFFSTSTGTGTFTVSTTGAESLSGYVEAIEVLGDNAPVYIGGGGVPASKPVEIEVFTSGSGGILDMGSSTEDPSFLIYASVRKGYTAPTFLKSAEAIIHSPNSIFGGETISLRDDGLYPDLLEKDGIYTGFYKPTSSNDFRISLRLDGFRTSSPVLKTFDEDNSRSSLPIDQDNICCGSTYNKPRASYAFQRFILHGARLRARDLIFYDERPLRIMDFQIDEYDSENDNITFSWTSPQATYGNNNNSVDSYRLVYNSNSRLVVDDVSGLVPANPVTVLPADIINGSLDPLKPYERQSVSVILNYDTLTSNLVYFTIDSKRNGVFSYPSPMIFLKLNVTITTTVAPSTTTSAATTPSSTTTTRPTTTTTPTTTTRTTSTTSPTTTTRTTTTTTSTTTKKSSSQRVIASSFFSLFLIIISIFIFTC